MTDGPDLTERRLVRALELGRPLSVRELTRMLSLSVTAVRNALRWCVRFGAVEPDQGHPGRYRVRRQRCE